MLKNLDEFWMIVENGCYNGCEDGQQVLKMSKIAGKGSWEHGLGIYGTKRPRI